MGRLAQGLRGCGRTSRPGGRWPGRPPGRPRRGRTAPGRRAVRGARRAPWRPSGLPGRRRPTRGLAGRLGQVPGVQHELIGVDDRGDGARDGPPGQADLPAQDCRVRPDGPQLLRPGGPDLGPCSVGDVLGEVRNAEELPAGADHGDPTEHRDKVIGQLAHRVVRTRRGGVVILGPYRGQHFAGQIDGLQQSVAGIAERRHGRGVRFVRHAVESSGQTGHPPATLRERLIIDAS